MNAQLTIGSLFAGIGGFDLAGEAYGWRTSWFVEWDAACRGWLAEHFPDRPIYGDITTVDFTELAYVDVLCGGFPCPPVSAAGKRLGKLDPRWLWPHFVRAIRDVRPRYVAIENVPGLLSTRDDEFGQPLMATVLGDLAALGYDAEWEVLSAGDVGSPQERERVWIVAYAERVERRGVGSDVDRAPRQRPVHAEDAAHRGGAELGHPTSARQRGAEDSGRARGAASHTRAGDAVESERDGARVGDTASGGRRAGEGLDVRRATGERASVGHAGGAGREERLAAALAGRARHVAGERCGVGDWSDATPVQGFDGTVRLIPREAADAGPESPLWPVADGLPGRVARLRAIGNTVVPQCVIDGPFRVIAEREAALALEAA